jgi:hypothetical protein
MVGFAETPGWGFPGQHDGIRQNRKMALGLVFFNRKGGPEAAS